MRLTKKSTDFIRKADTYSIFIIPEDKYTGIACYWVMAYTETGIPGQLHCSNGPMLYDNRSAAIRAVERINKNIRLIDA